MVFLHILFPELFRVEVFNKKLSDIWHVWPHSDDSVRQITSTTVSVMKNLSLTSSSVTFPCRRMFQQITISSHFKGKNRRSSLCKCSVRTTQIIITTLSHYIIKMYREVQKRTTATNTVSQKRCHYNPAINFIKCWHFQPQNSSTTRLSSKFVMESTLMIPSHV